jgi:plastocyanin
MRPRARPNGRTASLRACLGLTAAIGAFLAAAGAQAASLLVSVQAPDGRPVRGVVVMAHALDPAAHRPEPIKAVMDQVERAFLPDLLIIPAGSTVTFPNSDNVSHQIYSFSPAKRFQLPLYHGTPYPPVHFDQTGVVTLGCNIHDEMVGYLVVTDAPYYGQTDDKGSWSADVTRGRYRITVWHPRMRDNESDLGRELTIADADHATLTVRLTKPLQPAPVAERLHSWDH